MPATAERLVHRWSFTVADYHRMGEAGILGEDDRVDLIEVWVVDIGHRQVLRFRQPEGGTYQDQGTLDLKTPIPLPGLPVGTTVDLSVLFQ